MVNQAVILAAGRGTRLGAESNGDPKCLIRVGGKTLLEHQLNVFQSIGIKEVFVVVGHKADRVCNLVGNQCICVPNPHYAETNSLYSMRAAYGRVNGSFLLVNCDVLAHPEVYRRVAAAGGTALAFDSSSGGEAEHMKVSFNSGRLRAVSKILSDGETDGENVGILRFDKRAASLLFSEADAIIHRGGLKCWAPEAVDRIADRTAVRGVDVSDLPWTKIDFPGDLAFAREKLWPAMQRSVNVDAAPSHERVETQAA